MKKHNEELALRGFTDGNAFVDELLKQVDGFGNSLWKSVTAETGNYLTRANALDRFADAIERVTNSVLSDGQPVDAEKVEAAKMQMSNLRAAAERMRSTAASVGVQAAIKK